MIIDAHCHLLPPEFADQHQEISSKDATYAALFPEPGGRIATAEDLVRDMGIAGIDGAVAMGFGWTDKSIAASVNDYLLEVASRYPKKLYAFCSVNPAWGADAVTEAVRCLEAGAVGVGELHADTQGFDITDRIVLEPLMAELRERQLPITVHGSEPVGHKYPGKGSATPDLLLQFVVNFPDNRIILAHLGGGLPFYANMPEVADKFTNVWFDTAAIPFLYRSSVVSATIASVGAGRVLFGTDYPLLSHRRVLDYMRSAGVGGEQTVEILGGNASNLLNIAGP